MRFSGTDVRAFFDRINEILGTLRADGTLAALSTTYDGAEYASGAASTFDLDPIGQTVTEVACGPTPSVRHSADPLAVDRTRGRTLGAIGRILVVDDDALNRRLLTRSLERDGHEVTAAEDGRQALDLLAKDAPDVVLLDIVMPEMDGFEVLAHLKADPDLRHVPVIMVSGVEDTESVVRCIEMGADDYLQKPFDPVILRARIDAGMNRKRLHELEQQRVRHVFSRFLPESIAEELLARSDGEPTIGAERIEGTVLFTDLRGFTPFAESRSAEQVIEVLNRYLASMTDAVLDHDGTLVSYTGDGLMAAFGAPVRSDDHAARALEATREMVRDRLPAFNRWLVETGVCNGFRMGVGLNSGPLMSGNVGSERRQDYQVIGDTVNTAARIESLTKEADYDVLVADDTRSALADPPDDLVYVDEFEIRGRQTRMKLWGLA